MLASKYFVCSIGQPNKGYDDENLRRCITNGCFVLHGQNIKKGKIDKIAKGDLMILKYQAHFVGYGRAIDSLKTDKDLGNGWDHRVDVDQWIFGKRVNKSGIKNAQNRGSNYDTVKEVDREFALKEIGFTF